MNHLEMSRHFRNRYFLWIPFNSFLTINYARFKEGSIMSAKYKLNRQV